MVSFYEYLHLQKKNIVDMSELQLGLAFDQHNHVIENGRCNLCDILISSSRTKHCSVCNKERTTFRIGSQEQILIIFRCSLVANNLYKKLKLSVFVAILLSTFTRVICDRVVELGGGGGRGHM
jgi:hypothetical protein